MQDHNCNYVIKNDRVKPECCSYTEWNYHNPCKEDPVIRPKIFDTSWCENFSDFYDIGVGILTCAMLFGFTYIVHSYNMVVGEELKFTTNPMEEEDNE